MSWPFFRRRPRHDHHVPYKAAAGRLLNMPGVTSLTVDQLAPIIELHAQLEALDADNLDQYERASRNAITHACRSLVTTAVEAHARRSKP